MPNWCSTNITIQHNDVEKVKTLYEKLENWTNRNYMDNDFGHYWLGNIVLGANIGTIDDLECRGSIEYMNYHDNAIKIDTETAWSPQLEMWKKIIDKYLPGGELSYTAIEPGCGIYCTNDPYMIGKYNVDVWDTDIMDSCYNIDEDDLKEELQELLNTKIDDIDTLIEILEGTNWSENISIHEWEYIEVSEWN